MIPVRLSVPANAPWVDTGVDVATGERLDIRATGAWRDAWIDCGPDGHDAAHLRPLGGLKRCRTGKWLELVACVAQDLRAAQAIGAEGVLVAPRKGRLYLFANDARGMYWNNAGTIEVEIRSTLMGTAGPATSLEVPQTPRGEGGAPAGVRRSLTAILSGLTLALGAPAVSQPISEPDASESAILERLESDPLAQFDLGVAIVSPGDSVSEWQSLSETGAVLTPESSIAQSSDTIDSLLIAGGIRPDAYSRELIRILNPQLSDSLRLTPGMPVTLLRADSLPEGSWLAIQPYQGERRRIDSLLATISAQTEAIEQALADQEYARLRSATDRLIAIDRSTLRPQADQLMASANSLERYSFQLNAAVGSGSSASSVQSLVASAQATSETIAAQHQGTRTARWLISVTGPGQIVAGHCRLVWSVGGYTRYPGSGDQEALPLGEPIPVPPAFLVAWVERQGQAISPRLHVTRQQLLAVEVRRDALAVRERCDR